MRKSQYFWMFSAKQGCHLYNVFGMTRSLTGDWTRDLPHSKPALCFLNLNNKVMFKCVLIEYWFYSGNVHRHYFPRLECPVYYFCFLVSCSKSFIFQVYRRLWRECFINFSFKNPQHYQPFLAVFYKITILNPTYWEWPSLAQSSPVHRKGPHTSAMICLYTTI